MKIWYEFEPDEIRSLWPVGLIAYGMSERHLNTFTKRGKFEAEFPLAGEAEMCKAIGRKALSFEKNGIKGTVRMESDEICMWFRVADFCEREFGMNCDRKEDGYGEEKKSNQPV